MKNKKTYFQARLSYEARVFLFGGKEAKKETRYSQAARRWCHMLASCNGGQM